MFKIRINCFHFTWEIILETLFDQKEKQSLGPENLCQILGGRISQAEKMY